MVSSEKPMSIKNGEHGFRVMDLPEHNLSVSNIYTFKWQIISEQH